MEKQGNCLKSTLIYLGILFCIIIATVICCSNMKAQCDGDNKYSYHPNALYVSFQPTDFGVGIRYDYHIKGIGIYNSISYGNWYQYKRIGLRNHTKLTLGVMIPLPDYNGWQYDWTIGINYHHVGGSLEDFGNNYAWYNSLEREIAYKRIKYPLSFELGLTVKLPGFALGIRTDFPRWEPCVDITGMLFNTK